ncbi:hypothetical protein BXZ70DRAFT_886180 [Cristinia sonorae]|uniref:RNA polymerase II assembly factor Rtp1 C-terminal domain-containing protein n=1 Tax=Cristinia sonorae TaxID=1940300 RepID=A0A8K0XU96_9AGAR|nr:hypothetical protein BXZ70DRAFT_886180 [Cristinia sonorae]
MMQNPELASVITAGAFLVGDTRSGNLSDIRSVLVSRLVQYDKYSRREPGTYTGTLEDIQLETAKQSLAVISRVQSLLNVDSSKGKSTVSSSSAAAPPDGNVIGTRDLAQIRTLLSIFFKWAMHPLLDKVIAAIPTTSPGSRGLNAPIIDLTTVPHDFELLCSLLDQFVRVVLPDGIQSTFAPTHITVAILDRHLASLVRPCIVLGWLPKALASDSIRPVDNLRPLLIHFISMLPVQQAVTALTDALPHFARLPYARKACTFLLSRQLLRRDGVRGTISALFADVEELSDQAPLERFEQVSRLLRAIPTGMSAPDYFGTVAPQLADVLSANGVPPVQLRAAAFALSHMLTSEDDSTNQAVVERIILPIFHRPFLQDPLSVTEGKNNLQSPSNALVTLQALLINTDPSPALISMLLTPIIPALFSLSSQLERLRMADPSLRTSLQGFLGTWGRVIGAQEGIATLWLVVEGEGEDWIVDIAGDIKQIREHDRKTPLALFTPEDLEHAEENGDFDIDSNLLKLKPDPFQFVQYLKLIDRPDISSELFVMLLEGYRKLKSDVNGDPMRTLLYLQLIVQVQTQLSDDKSRANILKKPGHILSFIKHALESSMTEPSATSLRLKQEPKGLGLKDLRIVDEEEVTVLEEDADSDDEDSPEAPSQLKDDDMTVTAVNLLLSILEANPDLTSSTAPVLDEIFDLIETLATEGAEAVKPLAREARMVMTARLASSSMPASSTFKQTSEEESAKETYQKALKLLQDPLLPVRAHGLLLLRQLVSPRTSQKLPLSPPEEPALDKALIPGILSIFMQSLQDDDSYIFLNAVQGLAAMVDGYGKDTLKGLVSKYSQGLDGLAGSAMTQQDVDIKTRIGEALNQVIRRCGEALPRYADVLVPSLFAMVATTHLPTPLRVSALSLLAQCVNTSPIALLPYSEDIFEAIVDLLHVESVPMTRGPPKPAESRSRIPAEDGDKSNVPNAPLMDNQPTAANPKFPPLRRAALHFLSLLTRVFTSQILESSSISYTIPNNTIKRARITVGYVAVVDEDNIVRVMADETLEGLNRLSSALLGL